LKKPLLLPLAFFLSAALSLHSQELAGEGDDDRLYVIAGFEFDITGRTRPGALMHNAEFRAGEELRGREALEAYVRDRAQALANMRVLRDNSEVTYSVGERQADGAHPVTIMVRVEDSWNIIAFPVPQYNTNTGLQVDIRARDYNFMGTMSPLRIDLGYRRDADGQNSFRLMLDSSIPFTAWGYRWNFRFENVFEYRPDAASPFFFHNTTGLAAQIPIRATTLTVGFEESFIVNEANPHRHRYGSPWYRNPDNFQRGLYMSSRPFASWRIPTGLATASHGELAYTIGSSVTFNHEFARWPLQDFRVGPFAEVSHSLGFGRINWHGNYRRGLALSLTNSFSYDFSRHGEEPFAVGLFFNGTGHFMPSRFLGVSARLQSRHWSLGGRGYNDEAGDALRGVANRSIQAEYMLSLNTGFPLRAPKFAPSEWLGRSGLRFFDFEMHVAPTLDMALYSDPREGINTVATGGIEFMFFPAFMRSLYARLSFGWNALEALSTRRLPGGSNREISFTLGHFF